MSRFIFWGMFFVVLSCDVRGAIKTDCLFIQRGFAEIPEPVVSKLVSERPYIRSLLYASECSDRIKRYWFKPEFQDILLDHFIKNSMPTAPDELNFIRTITSRLFIPFAEKMNFESYLKLARERPYVRNLYDIREHIVHYEPLLDRLTKSKDVVVTAEERMLFESVKRNVQRVNAFFLNRLKWSRSRTDKKIPHKELFAKIAPAKAIATISLPWKDAWDYRTGPDGAICDVFFGHSHYYPKREGLIIPEMFSDGGGGGLVPPLKSEFDYYLPEILCKAIYMISSVNIICNPTNPTNKYTLKERGIERGCSVYWAEDFLQDFHVAQRAKGRFDEITRLIDALDAHQAEVARKAAEAKRLQEEAMRKAAEMKKVQEETTQKASEEELKRIQEEAVRKVMEDAKAIHEAEMQKLREELEKAKEEAVSKALGGG